MSEPQTTPKEKKPISRVQVIYAAGFCQGMAHRANLDADDQYWLCRASEALRAALNHDPLAFSDEWYKSSQ